MQFALFFGAAVFEIGGCYLIWLALRQGQPWLWAPAIVALALFGLLLALTGTESAGRAFAIYGGIYIAASVAFMAGIERVRPDAWDLAGVAICLLGAAVIFFAPRG
ncbi:YnfA family protein [Devosia ginsengisoli]|uniref:YnfA family protein n=1 Tax=Devosia ginsengisoli TaxID=400770 RepID=UPI0026EE9EBB|nr:YnfA family protein [Devosia ginsengisoli]MCR6671828.1 YnfA family protein [Devosia ginsengisoli]